MKHTHTGGPAVTWMAKCMVCAECLAHAKNSVSTAGANKDSYGNDSGKAQNSGPPTA